MRKVAKRSDNDPLEEDDEAWREGARRLDGIQYLSKVPIEPGRRRLTNPLIIPVQLSKIGLQEYSWMCGKAEKKKEHRLDRQETQQNNKHHALVSLVACTHMDRLKRNEYLIRKCDDQWVFVHLLTRMRCEEQGTMKRKADGLVVRIAM